MTLIGPQNFVGLTDKEATAVFRQFAKQYLTELQKRDAYNIDVFRLEQYLKNNYKFKNRSIYSLLVEALEYINLTLDGDYFRIIIQNAPIAKNKIRCNELIKLVLYGNRNIRPTNLIQNIVKHSVRYF